MSRIEHIIDRAIDFVFYTSCFAMIFAWLLTCTDVFMRYFLNDPIVWSVEINEYIIAGTTFLSAAYVLRKEGHVSIDSAIALLKPRTRALITTFTSVLGATVCLVVFGFGVIKTVDLFQIDRMTADKTLEIPYFILLAIIPVGFLLFSFQFIRRSCAHWIIWKDTPKIQEPKEEVFEI